MAMKKTEAPLPTERLKLSDLEDKFDPNNSRKHGERNQQAIAASLDRLGAARSIVLDANNNVVAGNGTLQQALAGGKIKNVVVVDADPDTLIAVRRSDWTPEEARTYSIADNQTSDLAGNDYEMLARNLIALQDEEDKTLIEATGLTDYEVLALVNAEWGAGGEPPPGDVGGRVIRFNREQWENIEHAIAPILDGDESATNGEAIAAALEAFIKMQNESEQ